MIKRNFVDTRQFARLKAHYLVKYKKETDNLKASKNRIASLRDISGGGVLFRAEDDLPISGTLDLQINFVPARKVISALAKVVWTRELKKSANYEVGASFIKIDPEDQKAIVKHVDDVISRIQAKKV